MEPTTKTKRYRLKNKNYATWATMMRAEMYSLGCLPLVKREPVKGVAKKNMKLYVLIMKHHQMLALGEFIDLEFKEKFKLKKIDKVAMVGQQQGPKRTGKCYNCNLAGHSAKECCKSWTNYKYAPPRANVSKTEGMSVSFIAIKEEAVEDIEEEEESISFYDPIATEIEIFGNLGNKGFYSQADINMGNQIRK